MPPNARGLPLTTPTLDAPQQNPRTKTPPLQHLTPLQTAMDVNDSALGAVLLAPRRFDSRVRPSLKNPHHTTAKALYHLHLNVTRQSRINRTHGPNITL